VVLGGVREVGCGEDDSRVEALIRAVGGDDMRELDRARRPDGPCRPPRREESADVAQRELLCTSGGVSRWSPLTSIRSGWEGIGP